MIEIGRRKALQALPVAGLATLFATGSAHSAAPIPRPVEPFVIGPFLLGDLYEETVTGLERSGGPEDLGADRDRRKLVAALNECRLFLLDVRDMTDPKAPKVARRHEGFPLLTAGGKPAYDFKKGKRAFTARIVSLRASRNTVRSRKTGPTQVVGFEVRLEMNGTDGILSSSSVLSMTRSVEYGVTGKRVKG